MTVIERCRWPELEPRYDRALRAAVAYILERFTVQGIIAAGSILAGKGGPSSDLDLYVIREGPQRQRIQRWFEDVPAEIFVNPPAMVRRYFEQERLRAITAHMFAAGFVVLDESPVVDELRREAAEWLARPLELSEAELTMRRYLAADAYDNARDIAAQDPVAATRILHSAVDAMLCYAFLAQGRRLPREKDLIAALTTLNAELGELAQRYYVAADSPARFALAEQIAQRAIGATGFFAWEWPPEDVAPLLGA